MKPSFLQTCAVLAVGLLTGCSGSPSPLTPVGYSRQSGDLARFFVQKASDYGARPVNTNGLQEIRTNWGFKADENGFQVLIDKAHREAFQAFLEKCFGKGTTSDKYPNLLYKAQDVGVGILCDFSGNPLHIICLRY